MAMSSSLAWVPVIPQLAKTFRVVALDLRGHGQSTYNKIIQNHDEHAEDIKLFVDALGINKFFLVGWSMGGGITMKFAANYPEYVEGLILQNSIGVQGLFLFKLGQDGKPTEERIVTESDALVHPLTNLIGEIIANKDKEH